LRRLRKDPARFLSDAGLDPDPWQADILRSSAARFLLNITRQGGKSLVAAAMVLKTAFFIENALVLLLSPTHRQSGELFKAKVLKLYNDLGRPVPSARPRDNATMLELQNGSRVISLPGDEETVRGYSAVNLLVVDEASLVTDTLYRAVRPMLAVSKGKIMALSTPHGKRGWFFEEWRRQSGWEYKQVRASECPRIGADFLEEERIAIGDVWFSQEYETEFVDTITSLFRQSDIEATLNPTLAPVDLGM